VSEMKTSEVLDLAADMIEKRGWVQGTEGWGGVSAPLCLEGGILAALGHPAFVGITHKEMWACPAYRAVQDYLEYDRELWWWNDTYGRTKEEVIEVLRAAAAVERTKEESLEGSVTKKELVK
jgi:hypothetical protein